LATAGLLREAVAMLTGIPPGSADIGHWCRVCRTVGDHGRPVAFGPSGLTMRGVYLSAARAGEIAAVAASSQAPVGLDIVKPKLHIEFDTSILTHAEASDLAAADSLERSTVWNKAVMRKMAVGKATGFGGAIVPASLDTLGGVLRSWPPSIEEEVSGGVQLVDVKGLPEGYLGALAYLGARRPIIVVSRTSNAV